MAPDYSGGQNRRRDLYEIDRIVIAIGFPVYADGENSISVVTVRSTSFRPVGISRLLAEMIW